MHSRKQIAVIVAALATTTSLVCGQAQPAAQSSSARGFAGLGRSGIRLRLPTSIGAPAPRSTDALPSRDFTQIDVPGATLTAAESINPQGNNIVGIYGDSNGSTHGFLLSN